MATDYLTLDQVCEALGVTSTEIKGMVADGRLHEFRDAGKVFFKRAEVERMAAKEGSSIVDLAATDEMMVEPAGDENASFASALTSLADSSSSLGLGDISPGAVEPSPDQPSELNLLEDEPAAASPNDSGSAMGLSPLDMSAEDFPQDLPAAPSKGPAKKEFTSEIDLLPDEEQAQQPAKPAARPAAAAPDMGLSGSSIINLEPSGEEEAAPKPAAPARPAAKGISVFEDEEVEIAADPMGETRISAGVDELEAVGSGSGLLDLTQVSDDTSLGAELLDVISPTEAAETETEAPVVEAAETVEDEGVIVAEAVGEEPMAAAPAMAAAAPAAAAVAPRMAASVAAEMPGTTAMNITCLLGVLSLVLVGLATAGQLQGVWPSFLTPIAKDVIHYSVFGGLGLVAIVVGVLGILAGRR